MNIENIELFFRKYKSLIDLSDDMSSSVDLLDGINDLLIEYTLSKDDVLFILTNYNTNFDCDNLLQIIFDEWVDDGITTPIWEDVIKITNMKVDDATKIKILSEKFKVSRVM